MNQAPVSTPVYHTWQVLLLALLAFVPLSAHALTVAAANSTCELMEKIGARYTAKYGHKVEFICKSSGLLANGLMGNSLQADVYLSASQEWMDKMNAAGQMAAGTVSELWSNSVVVAAPKNSQITMTKLADIASEHITKVISGDPSTMPLGRHAKEALEASGLWLSVRTKIETRKHITLVAEALEQSNEHTVGFLFKTNMTAGLRILHVVDPSLHAPVRYYIGRFANAAQRTQADQFIVFLRSDEARELIEQAGFSIIPH